MFVMANFLTALAQVLSLLVTAMSWLIVIRALISWVSPDPDNPIVQFLHQVTEPVLEPIRRLIPTWRIGLDLSPIIAFVLLRLVGNTLVPSLMELSLRLR